MNGSLPSLIEQISKNIRVKLFLPRHVTERRMESSAPNLSIYPFQYFTSIHFVLPYTFPRVMRHWMKNSEIALPLMMNTAW